MMDIHKKETTSQMDVTQISGWFMVPLLLEDDVKTLERTSANVNDFSDKGDSVAACAQTTLGSIPKVEYYERDFYQPHDKSLKISKSITSVNTLPKNLKPKTGLDIQFLKWLSKFLSSLKIN